MYTSGIPFVAKSPEISQITGEVYIVTPETLALVDELESYNPHSPEKSWYVREEIRFYVMMVKKKRPSSISMIRIWGVYLYIRFFLLELFCLWKHQH